MIAIIDYNAGNVRSVQNALNRLGAENEITNEITRLQQADKVIFPGVGHAQNAMEALNDYSLTDVIKNLKQPVLGICLGLQLMCERSEEGNTECLGIFNTRVKRFPSTGKVPHMGWNMAKVNNKSGLLTSVSNLEDAYFVHSYYAELCKETTSVCDYLVPFSATLEKDNFYATQYHPEKSGTAGEKILRNFLEL